MSEKNKIRAAKMKKAIFFNPLIRYHYLEQLKLNLTAMMTIHAFSEADFKQQIISICIFAVLNLLPVYYVYFLIKKSDKLHE